MSGWLIDRLLALAREHPELPPPSTEVATRTTQELVEKVSQLHHERVALDKQLTRSLKK